jgi:hypothetical protein
LTFIEQHSIYATIGRVYRIHGYRLKTGAALERIVPDTGNAIGNDNTSQARTAIESVTANANNIIGDDNISQV